MDRGSGRGSWLGDEASSQEIPSEEEISTEMSVDYEAQLLVYMIIQEAVLIEKTPDGMILDGENLKHLYAWLSACRGAMNQHDQLMERISNEPS